MLNMYWMYALIIISLVALYNFQDNTIVQEMGEDQFLEQVMAGHVEKVKINRENASVTGVLTKEGAKALKLVPTNKRGDYTAEIKTLSSSADRFDDKMTSINQKLETEGKPTVPYEFENGSDVMKIFWYFGPILLFVLFMVFMSRRMSGSGGGPGGIFNVGKSRAKVFDKSNGSNVTFKDVAGLSEAKVEIEEIVEFLKNPERYTELGAKIPRGALLVGPPGTGKTLLAKAVAGEANVPFLSMSGSDFVEMFVGVGAARVRDLFKQAKEKAPCIVFIDEIDAVGRARGKNPNMGSNDERENTLNQMLTEMDGFGSNSGVIILAATNRADMLDKALLRPGRFDRQILVDLPELTDRMEILNVHLRNIKVNSSLDVEQIARQTAGFSGADLANVCNEAALIAARNNSLSVDMEDFRKAIDRIVGGIEKKSTVYNTEEKVAIATHEAGHATVSWLLKYGNPLVKVTIVPRGRAGGYAMYAPEERHYTPLQSLLDTICTLVSGRAAEEVFTEVIGTGASDDLEKATKLALSLVMYYGGSPRLKNLNYYDSTGQTYGFNKPYSEATAKIIDEEVARIIDEQYARAKQILSEHAREHNEIRDLLIEREVIYHDDVQAILGPRPWKSRTDEAIAMHNARQLENKNQQTDKADTSAAPAKADDKSGGTALPAVPAASQPGSTEDDDSGTPPPFTKGN
ncbi:MAG: ATP-dependent zinc metalloprotease FtsH [Muribaculaceae bacterium]|nr:ATP-dependent zinc metalloprotease FtsH [Muribaculaceae bacterium]